MVYSTKGVCSKSISYELDGTKIKSVNFDGGCPGNLLGIGQIVVGMEISEVVDKFRGITCGTKPTSCPDQLAIALSNAI